jgi:hypothetical protein
VPKPGKPRGKAQLAFMRKALERGYVPLTPKQVAYFERVVHGRAAGGQARAHQVRAVTKRADRERHKRRN